MTNLLIDAGNTSCKYAVSTDGYLASFLRDDGGDVVSSVRSVLGGRHPDMAVVSSVRGSLGDAVPALSGLCGRMVEVSGAIPLPITLGYETPLSLGADRIAAAVGAYSLFPGEDLLIFDFGTAITIDRVTADGVFAGGNISIGLRSRLRALHLLTAQLPEVPVNEPCDDLLGVTTRGALASGAISGTMFEVGGYINSYPEHRVVFSGGDSIFLANRMKNPIFADYNLVLRGLAYIAEYYNAEV